MLIRKSIGAYVYKIVMIVKVKKRKIIILGTDLASVANGCLFSAAGHNVTFLDSIEPQLSRYLPTQVGKDRSGSWKTKPHDTKSSAKNIFQFEQRPYWDFMPEITEHYFDLIENKSNVKTPYAPQAFTAFFSDTYLGKTKFFGNFAKDNATYEAFEPRASELVSTYREDIKAYTNYSRDNYLYATSVSESLKFGIKYSFSTLKLNTLSNYQKHLGNYFETTQLKNIFSIPLILTGKSPKDTPALYAMLNHFHASPSLRLTSLYRELRGKSIKYGAKERYGHTITNITLNNNRISSITYGKRKYSCDVVISDVANLKNLHTFIPGNPEQRLENSLIKGSPCLVIHLGVKKQYPFLTTHNFIIARDLEKQLPKLARSRTLPKRPSYYLYNSNKHTPNTAPPKHENLSIFMPISPKCTPDEAAVNNYVDELLQSIENDLHLDDLVENIVYKNAEIVSQSGFNQQSWPKLDFAINTAIQHPSIPNLLYANAGSNLGLEPITSLLNAERVYKRFTGDNSPGPLASL